MDIPSSVIDQVMRQQVQLGDVYKIAMTQEDGITPQGNYKERNKFFVVLGQDEKGNIYGGVVINSTVNHNLPAEITDYYMPIKRETYPFLRYDSFVNCSQLKQTTTTKLFEGEKMGAINDTDYELIVNTVKSSKHETKVRLRRFGLI